MSLEKPYAASPNHVKEYARTHAAVYQVVMDRCFVVHAALHDLALWPHRTGLFDTMNETRVLTRTAWVVLASQIDRISGASLVLGRDALVLHMGLHMHTRSCATLVPRGRLV